MAAALYIVLSELRDELLLPDTTQDTRLNRAIVDASRAVDAFLKQLPGTFAPQTQTKYFDVAAGQATIPYRGPDPWLVTDNTRQYGPMLTVPNLISITTLKTDEDGDGAFEVTWTANTDYFLYPLNDEVKRQIVVNADIGRYAFPTGRRRVQVVGSWGFVEDALTPYAIRRATLLLAERYFKRSADLTGNPIAPGISPSKMFLPMDTDVQALLGQWAGRYKLQWLAA